MHSNRATEQAPNGARGSFTIRISRAATGVQAAIGHFEEFGLPYARSFLAAVPEPIGPLSVVGGLFPLAHVQRRKRRH